MPSLRTLLFFAARATFFGSYSPFEGRLLFTEVKNVRCTLVQTLRLCTGRTAHRGSTGIGLLFLDHGIRSGEGSASRPGRSLPLGKTRYPLYRRLGGPQGRSGRAENLASTGIRSPDRPAHGQSLYRLSYPGPTVSLLSTSI